MDKKKINAGRVLVTGAGSLTYSIAVCLLKANYAVNLCTDNESEAVRIVHTHFSEMNNKNGKPIISNNRLKISGSLKIEEECGLAIVITEEDAVIKKDIINQLENEVSPDTVIAVNTESISLHTIQNDANHPDRIIGLNWTEPAHTTRFLEIITNPLVKAGLADEINDLAKTWNKDPYTVENFGIRSRLISAMVREAFYLVENGFASVEDIDRACRNDAGYYLPFAGNCRYMDLMGTYSYGMVMKDLNPDLSKDQNLPAFFTDIIKKGGLGIKNGKGLYQYSPDEIKRWEKVFSEFSYQIEEIISKYPFNYKKEIQ